MRERARADATSVLRLATASCQQPKRVPACSPMHQRTTSGWLSLPRAPRYSRQLSVGPARRPLQGADPSVVHTPQPRLLPRSRRALGSLAGHPRLGLCLNSLQRLQDSDRLVPFDTVVIDESEQVLAHFLSETMSQDGKKSSKDGRSPVAISPSSPLSSGARATSSHSTPTLRKP